MPELTGPPPPPVLKRDGFQMCAGQFSVGGVQRVEGSRLRELFSPLRLRLKRDQKAAEESARELFKKPFFVAQLRYYGISAPSSAKVADLREMLHDSVFEGKCQRVPQSVVRLEDELRRDYEPMQQAWEAEVRAYEIEKNRRGDEAFAQCKTAGERANCDLNRFMNHYFLTNGKPDRKKTTKPLALHGFHHRAQLHQMAGNIEGLYTKSGGRDEYRTLCIGWNSAAVQLLAGQMANQGALAEKNRKEAERAKEMEAHQKHLQSRTEHSSEKNKKKKGPKSKSQKAFNLQGCRGSYILHCKEVTEGWDIRGSLTMDVHGHDEGLKSVMIADYKLGVIEGTMLLSQSEEILTALSGPVGHSGDSEESEYSYPYDSDESDTNASKEKNGKRSLSDAVADANDRAQEGGTRTTKKRKIAPSLSRRVYLRLRGRETGEGEMIHETEAGHIDLLDQDCTRFMGLIYEFPYVGKNVEFQGYKVSDSPKETPGEWNAFSDRAYEHRGRGRFF